MWGGYSVVLTLPRWPAEQRSQCISENLVKLDAIERDEEPAVESLERTPVPM